MLRIEIEQNGILIELKRLNGGEEIALSDSRYEDWVFPADFEQWYAQAEQKNPVLEYVKQELEVAKTQLSVNKTENLPDISVGYMRERVLEEQFQGITFGVSIPLWENKNKLKQAKAELRATESYFVLTTNYFIYVKRRILISKNTVFVGRLYIIQRLSRIQ